MTVETLFEVFCGCAELNPEPNEGKCQSSLFRLINFCSRCCIYFISSINADRYFFSFIFASEDEEEHNWIFSADQMEYPTGIA